MAAPVSLSYDPPGRTRRGRTYVFAGVGAEKRTTGAVWLAGAKFHSRMIRTVVGGGGPTYLKDNPLRLVRLERCRFRAEIVNYADDFRVLGKAPAAEMLTAVKRIMEELNERKTRCLRCPEEPMGFLGYRIGRNYRPKGKGAYIGTFCRKISDSHRCTGCTAIFSGDGWLLVYPLGSHRAIRGQGIRKAGCGKTARPVTQRGTRLRHRRVAKAAGNSDSLDLRQQPPVEVNRDGMPDYPHTRHPGLQTVHSHVQFMHSPFPDILKSDGSSPESRLVQQVLIVASCASMFNL